MVCYWLFSLFLDVLASSYSIFKEMSVSIVVLTLALKHKFGTMQTELTSRLQKVPLPLRAHYSISLPSYAVATQVQFYFRFSRISG